MRAALPFLVVIALLLIALVLPSARDTSVAAWWWRVRYQMTLSIRVVVVVAGLALLVWFVVMPLFARLRLR